MLIKEHDSEIIFHDGNRDIFIRWKLNTEQETDLLMLIKRVTSKRFQKLAGDVKRTIFSGEVKIITDPVTTEVAVYVADMPSIIFTKSDIIKLSRIIKRI